MSWGGGLMEVFLWRLGILMLCSLAYGSYKEPAITSTLRKVPVGDLSASVQAIAEKWSLGISFMEEARS
jgi:hypothetical protein